MESIVVENDSGDKMADKAYETFRERVRCGAQCDRNGNIMSQYRPDCDTFFACLSFAMHGNASERKVIRTRLLLAAIKIVTGKTPESVREWLMSTKQDNIEVIAKCCTNPAIESLAITLGAPELLSARHSWVTRDVRFKRGFYSFITNNHRGDGAQCKYVLAFLFTQVYFCDVCFFGFKAEETKIDQIAAVRKQSLYKTLGGHKLEDLRSPRLDVFNAQDIDGIDGVELVTPRVRRPEKEKGEEDTGHRSYIRSPSFYNEVDSSSEEDVNWLEIWLMMVEGSRGEVTYELFYTSSEANRKTDEKWLARNARYSLRVYRYDHNKKEHCNQPLRERNSLCQPPPKGRRVHVFCFNASEVGDTRLLQVSSAVQAPRHQRDRSGCKRSKQKPLYIYLYFKDRGLNGTAHLISRADLDCYPGHPVFYANDRELGNADGIFVVRSRSTDRANRYIQGEMRVEVTSAAKNKHGEEEI